MSKIIDGGLVIIVVTAYLYAISTAHFSGYLMELGVEPDLITRNANQILYHGMFVLLEPILKVAIYIIVAIFLFVICAYFYAVVMSDLKFSTRKWLLRLKTKLTPKKMKRSEYIALSLSKKFFMIGILPIIFFTSLHQAEKEGVASARRLHEKIVDGKLNSKMVINLVFPSGEQKIYPIACGTNTCVGVNIDNKKFILFENKAPTPTEFFKI